MGGYGTWSVMVMNTIFYSNWVGMHQPHRKVVGLVRSVLLITELVAIWLPD